MKIKIEGHWILFCLLCTALLTAACSPIVAPAAAPTPTVDPDIYNVVPDTTVYEPGACIATLDAPTPAHTSNTLGQSPSGEIAPGEYEVGVAADFGSSLWFKLNGMNEPSWINSESVASLEGVCAAP